MNYFSTFLISVLCLDNENCTLCNVYLEAGTDSPSRSSRENYCTDILPNLLTNRCSNGCAGGDWNSIISKSDASNAPESKMSPELKRLVSLMDWKDSHRILHPFSYDYSHYYKFGENCSGCKILIFRCQNVRFIFYVS